jgi:hypothetical protein
MNNQFVCALSGIKVKEEEMEDVDFPDGWIEVRLTRRYVNPKWDAIQYVKAGLVQQYLQGIPEDARDEQIMAISIQVEAQYSALEATCDKYIDEEVTSYIANPDSNSALMAEYNKLRKMLGMKPEKAEPLLRDDLEVDESGP